VRDSNTKTNNSFSPTGKCFRADCWYSHNLEDTTCRYWLAGFCIKGIERYRHRRTAIDPLLLCKEMLASLDTDTTAHKHPRTSQRNHNPPNNTSSQSTRFLLRGIVFIYLFQYNRDLLLSFSLTQTPNFSFPQLKNAQTNSRSQSRQRGSNITTEPASYTFVPQPPPIVTILFLLTLEY